MRARLVPLHGLAPCFHSRPKGTNRHKLWTTAEQIENLCTALSKASDLPFVPVIRVFAGSVRFSSEPVPPPEVLLLWQECQDVCLLGEFITSFFWCADKTAPQEHLHLKHIFVFCPHHQALERVSLGQGVSTFALNWWNPKLWWRNFIRRDLF